MTKEERINACFAAEKEIKETEREISALCARLRYLRVLRKANARKIASLLNYDLWEDHSPN